VASGTQVRFNLADPNLRCSFVNVLLHLVVWDQQDQMKIAAVDVQGKVRRMVPVPPVADWMHWMCYFSGNIR
jgi:hypothetical protein